MTKKWTTTVFETKKEYVHFIRSKWKMPGEYNLKNTKDWLKPREHFLKTGGFIDGGKYCDYVKNTKQYNDFWVSEGRKCKKGVIFDDFYVTGYFYDYLNYTPIFDKVKKITMFPEVWDGDYHYYLYIELCILYGKNALVNKSRQKGFAQPVDSQVLTDKNFINIGDIKPGDNVFSRNGSITKVTNTYPQGKKNVYEVVLNDGRKTYCTENHLWQVFDTKAKKEKTLMLSEMMENYLFETSCNNKKYRASRYFIPHTKPVQYLEKEYKVHPYIIGCLLGDGCLSENVRFCSMDSEMFDYVLERTEKDMYEWGKIDKNSGSNILSKCVRRPLILKSEKPSNKKHQMLEDLRELKLMGSNCYNKFIPKEYLTGSVEQRMELLKGLIDTDGSVLKKDVGYEYTTVSKQLSDDILSLCYSLGLGCKLRICKPDKLGTTPVYRIRIVTDLLITRLTRKVDRFNENLKKQTIDNSIRRNYSGIKSITKLDTQKECICIEVEDDSHTYLTDSYIVTHNTLKNVSIFKNDFILDRGTVNKIITKEEPQLKMAWDTLLDAVNFSNMHTGWYRQMQGSGYERAQTYDGKEGNKKVKKGRSTVVKGLMTKLSATRSVGGQTSKGWFEEGGVNDTLHTTYEFLSPAIKQGGVATGLIIAGGSVGQLKDCEPLRRYTYAPNENGFLGVPDVVNPEQIVSYFVPHSWNYIHEIRDEEDPDMIIGIEKCYDEDGNSDLVRAKFLINQEDEKQQKKSPIDYTNWKSQNPETLDDLYGARESNIFPVHIINPHYNYIMSEYKDVTVELEETLEGVDHKLVNGRIADFPVTATSHKDGCVVIYKFPKSTKFGLHVAGVDPVSNIRRNKNQESLMSCYIYQLAHEFEGEFVQGEIVASYTGRFEDPEKTYRTILNLIKMYNARTVIENDNKGFIDWMVYNNQQVYMVRRSEIPILRELVPNSSIADDYGLRMGSGMGDKVKKYCFEKLIEYLTARIGDEEVVIAGEKVLKTIHGVKRIKDRMLLKEMLNYNETLNVDRIIAASIAIMFGTLLESRNVFYKVDKRDEKNKIYEPVRLNSLVSSYKLPSFTRSMRGRFGLK